MIIALDFDGTAGRDLSAWGDVVHILKKHGHDVCIVTNNYPNQREDISYVGAEWNVPVFFAKEADKGPFMEMRGVDVDVWIDDNPEVI